MIDRVRENRKPKKVIRVSLRESYGEIRRVPVNLFRTVFETAEGLGGTVFDLKWN